MNNIRPSYNLILAKDGMDAILLLNKLAIKPDQIFIDVNMPRINGLELLDRLKHENQFQNIPFYMISTSRNPEHMKAADKLGAERYLIKPNDQSMKELLGEVIR